MTNKSKQIRILLIKVLFLKKDILRLIKTYDLKSPFIYPFLSKEFFAYQLLLYKLNQIRKLTLDIEFLQNIDKEI